MLLGVLLATTQAVTLRDERSQLRGPAPSSGREVPRSQAHLLGVHEAAGDEPFDELGAFQDELFLASLESDDTSDQHLRAENPVPREERRETKKTDRKLRKEKKKRDKDTPDGDMKQGTVNVVPGSGHMGLPSWNRDITFVHVGKCAGVSVGDFLHANAIQFHEVHVRPVTHEELGRMVVVPLRDPIKRTISAFNWRHPSTQGIDGRSQEEQMFYQCFNTVNAFAEALDPLSGAGVCNQVARRMFGVYPNRGPSVSNHIGKGYQYYLQFVMDELANRDVFVVRVDQDHFEHDLHQLLHRYGVPVVSSIVPRTNNDETHHYPKRGDTHLSNKGYAALKSILQTEYAIYNYLLARR
jgi:hypothetical protein